MQQPWAEEFQMKQVILIFSYHSQKINKFMEKPFRSHNPLGVLFYKNHRFPEFKEVTILEGPLNSNFFSSLSLSLLSPASPP
jgi:hypothetical protein